MYNYHSTPFYDLPSNSAYTNLTLHSVHLSPEELAAIDHGLMSVYGTGNSKSSEKENLIFNTPAPASQSANRPSTTNNYGYNTPTPTPMIFNDGKQAQNTLFQRNNHYNDTYNTPQNTQNQTPYTPIFTNTYTSPVDEKLIKTYEDRIEGILRQEREKYEAMESNYRQQLEQLKKNEFGYSEKLKLEQIIQDLRRQIDNLERQLSETRRNGSTSSNTEKIEALKLHYDRKIATLVGQFEQEKASALEIMKTRAKAEINLIIPKLKAQLQANLERNQSEIVNKIKAQAQNYIQKMKQDFQMERQVLIEHLRRKHFEELKQVKNQLQMKFEMKLNEERRRTQQQQSNPYRSYASNFGSNTGLFGDEPSFLL